MLSSEKITFNFLMLPDFRVSQRDYLSYVITMAEQEQGLCNKW